MDSEVPPREGWKLISEDSLKIISHIFYGDESNWYTYKGGPKLVKFFNKHYDAKILIDSIHSKVVSAL